MEPVFNIFRDPETRYYKLLSFEEAFPMRLRVNAGRILGGILLLYLILFVAPYILSTLKDRFPVPASGARVTLDKVGPATVGAHILGYIPAPKTTLLIPLDPTEERTNAFILVILILWLGVKMLNAYRNSIYYDVEAMLERGETGAQTPWTTKNYETCAVLWRTKYGDLLRAFTESSYGKHILSRLGIDEKTMTAYLTARITVIDHSTKVSDLRTVFTLRDLVSYLLKSDQDFYQFLFGLGIRERELTGAVEWVERDIKKKKQKERFWGRVALGQAPAFGADFAYGGAYRLGRYSTDLSRAALSGGSNFRFVYGSREIEELEIVLSRGKEANALLVGEEGAGKMDVILDFARDIMNGYAHPSLAKKRVMAFHAAAMVAGMKSKSELEQETLRVFSDAAAAGNIILVVDDLPGFLESARTVGSDVMSLIDPFLGSDKLQVIATADNARFHGILESNGAIMRRFTTVLLAEPEQTALLRILEEAAETVEKRGRVRFTYPAITEIANSAEKYITNGVMPDKALDLLAELVPWAHARGGKGLILLKKLDVLEYVRAKTQIPVGEMNDEERDKLMKLAELLRGQVIGQEEALDIIADAMRRSRAGVRSENRPIGSFLFLGPTGVGKTETAKALARVFFGDESAMQRLDMSEYQGEDGLNRMIGAMDGTQGTLPTILKEHPYGVLLLDEFEKTHPRVLDLFLQIFDEGVFHDAQGKKVNGRNTIFIATSNAGADLIRSAMAEGIDLSIAKKEIIDRIITAGKYKPELINRFDGVILFRPLGTSEYEQIAVQMLEKLQKRLREQSINLVINQPLIDAVMTRGVDPAFGARPMARAVQELVEKKVAELIIAGKAGQGSTIEFSAEDLV